MTALSIFGAKPLIFYKMPKAKQAREIIKQQAEGIRSDIINRLDNVDDAIFLCDATSLARYCEFWLVNNEKEVVVLISIIKKQKQLLDCAISSKKEANLLYNNFLIKNKGSIDSDFFKEKQQLLANCKIAGDAFIIEYNNLSKELGF